MITVGSDPDDEGVEGGRSTPAIWVAPPSAALVLALSGWTCAAISLDLRAPMTVPVIRRARKTPTRIYH